MLYLAKNCKNASLPSGQTLYSLRKRVPKTAEDMTRIWHKLSKTKQNVAQSDGQTLMASIRKTLRLIGRQGVYAPFDRK